MILGEIVAPVEAALEFGEAARRMFFANGAMAAPLATMVLAVGRSHSQSQEIAAVTNGAA